MISKTEAEEKDPMSTPRAKMPSFAESPAGIAFLCILAALDCVMAHVHVSPAEHQEAVRLKFEQAGVKMPEGLVEAQDD
mgnify:CR=1 FL=1